MSAWLIDTLLYTGLLMALVLVLRRPVGRFFGPQLAYGLWALPFLRLLLPPIVLPASLAPEPAPAPAMPAAEWVPAAMDVPVETAAPAVTLAAPAPPAWEWADLIAPAASIWAGAALAFLAWRVVTYRRMRRELLKGARPVGEIGRIRLVEAPALAAPVAFGVLDKVIALPPLFMAQPDIAARDLAIAHELAHHKGHDLLANFAAQALLALHWFNPVAWFGWRAMRRDQEAACDARVLAGRGREERIRYARLIAGVATGPRPILISGALAASMACPVLGERSIVHRLRSLSMSETSRRRRLFGRTMVAAGALALPLTASISYSVASAQVPDPSATELSPVPATSSSPELGDDTHGPGFVVRRVGPDGKHTVREFSSEAPQAPQGSGPQPPQFHWQGEWDSEEFEREMREFEQEMEQFSEQAEQQGEQWARWAERYSQRWEQWGEQYAEAQERRAEALAEAVEHRAEAQVARAEALAEAREQRAEALAEAAEHRAEARASAAARSSAMSRARDSIANNRALDAEVRDEILRDLDVEIGQIEGEDD